MQIINYFLANHYRCGICYLEHNAIVKLKGICVDPELQEEQIEPFDTDYYIYGQVNGRPHFV